MRPGAFIGGPGLEVVPVAGYSSLEAIMILGTLIT